MKINQSLLNKIKKLFDKNTWSKGKEYYHNHLITNVLLQEDIVHAQCLGTYNYTLTLQSTTQHMNCSCPCDFNCKHLAALVLWLMNNETTSTHDLQDKLMSKSKKELIDIILKLQTISPDLIHLYATSQNSQQGLLQLIQSLDTEYEYDSQISHAKRTIIEQQLLSNKDFQLLFTYVQQLSKVDVDIYSNYIIDNITTFLQNYDAIFPLSNDEKRKLNNLFSSHYLDLDDYL